MIRCTVLDRASPDPHTRQVGILFCIEPNGLEQHLRIFHALHGPVGVIQGCLYPDGRWWVPSSTDLSAVIENWEQSIEG